MDEIIQQFHEASHRKQLIELWRRVFGYESAHNAPQLVLEKKLAIGDGLLFVAESNGKVIGSIMAGYDGHRGWIYSLAVLPEYRRRGVGSRLVQHAENRLIAMGCPKINLQIMAVNEEVESFYRKLGYETEQRVSMGKKISINVTPAKPTAAPNDGLVTPVDHLSALDGPPSVS